MFAAIVESMATVGRWMSWCPPNYSLQDATAWYERSAQAWAAEGDREFGIFDASSGEVLGCVGINQINRVNLYGNMGYWVRTSCEKARRRIDRRAASGELRVREPRARSRRDRRPAGQPAKPAGSGKDRARFECIARSRLQFKGETRDAAVYSLVRDDALADPAAGAARFCQPAPDGSTLGTSGPEGRRPGWRTMEPIAFLVVLPIVIGIVAELIFRDTTHATLAAAIGTAAALGVCMWLLAPPELWTWLAVLLVSPLAIASALATVLVVYGRSQAHRRRRRHDL
jgi:hypothetical protein